MNTYFPEKQAKNKKRIIFRTFPFNQLSFPTLLNIWEQHGLDEHFKIILTDTSPSLSHLTPITSNDIILYSFMTPHLPVIHQEIQQLKHTGVLVAGGGPHISGEQELAWEIGFDFLFCGPAETTFLQFGNDLLQGNIITPKIYKCNPEDQPANAIDQYFPLSKHTTRIPPLEIMRGCRWHCSYCTTGNNKSVYRGIDSIKNYLDEVSRRGGKRINYVCPSALEYKSITPRRLNMDAIEEVLQLTQSYHFKFIEFGIFPSEIRPDTVNPEIVKMLHKYVSHKSLTIGAQSGSNERLKDLKRGHTVEQIEEAVAITNESGFMAILDFIIAYPDETTDERNQTIAFIKKLTQRYRVKTQLHHFFPLSGSALAYRFPSFLSQPERDKFLQLTKDGIARDGWLDNETQAIAYFNWLKQTYPGYYSKYI